MIWIIVAILASIAVASFCVGLFLALLAPGMALPELICAGAFLFSFVPLVGIWSMLS